MTFRYIGSKARLVGSLAAFVETVNVGRGRFVDAFCGTGAMAEAAADMGLSVWVNDSLESAVVMAEARLTARQDASFASLGGYHAALDRLNALAPEKGFIWSTYSPASVRTCGFERRYFTEANAGRIDAIRGMIGTWANDGTITLREAKLLMGDLISALNRVANIAGTYGCFLSTWQKPAFDRIDLRPRALRDVPVDVTATVGDVYDLVVAPEDIVYLDPPYTKRQYASYYHILETVVIGDRPVVEGVSGLRPWKHKASPFCYKSRALDALCRLVEGLHSDTVMLSYSAEGHVPMAALIERLELTGVVECVPLETLGRYRPNRTASANGDGVAEFMVRYQKAAARLSGVATVEGANARKAEIKELVA